MDSNACLTEEMEMSKFTKAAIKAAFMKLLKEKPFESITVKEISEAAGINRNTFYYNFKDVYALVDEILQEEIEELIEENRDCTSWSEILLCAADFALMHKKAIYHLHHSLKREELDKYFRRMINHTVNAYVKRESEGEALSEEDINFLADFYSCALTGMMMKWLDSDMTSDFREVVQRVGIMFDSNVKQAVKTLAERNKN